MIEDELSPPSAVASGAAPIEAPPAPAPASDMRSRDFSLIVETGSLRGQRFEFDGQRRVVIGRSKHCDIEVFDERVSRQHCTITFDGEKAHVKDLGSTHGTLLNGFPVGLAMLESGDSLTLADTRIRFALGQMEGTVKLPRAGCEFTTESGRPLRRPALRIAIPDIELLGVLGEGGTSAVFKGRDATGNLVAVKVLRVFSAPDPDDRERFLREGETAAALDHPNIVRVLGHGEVASSALYIIMELVHGETVRARLARTGALPVQLALHITRQIASALDYARRMATVHRDVKPENIIVTDDGIAKLVDFGLAKSVALSGRSGVTRVGDVLGTLAYMSPEQIESSVTADHRSDIYSLGATLYHMVAGQTPFEASGDFDYMRKIQSEEPRDLRQLRPDVPPIICSIIARCMRKRPSERYETAGEIVRIASTLLSSVENKSTVS